MQALLTMTDDNHMLYLHAHNAETGAKIRHMYEGLVGSDIAPHPTNPGEFISVDPEVELENAKKKIVQRMLVWLWGHGFSSAIWGEDTQPDWAQDIYRPVLM